MSAEKAQRAAAKVGTQAHTRPVDRLVAIQWLLGIAAAVAAIVIAWAEWRPIGDYWVALAAGRDIWTEGLSVLTATDTWSFTASDRVWFNQNWGTHLLYYLTYAAGGEWGTLALKALILAAIVTGVAGVCRHRGVSWPVSLVAGGAALAGGLNYIDLRPNLITLALISPLVCLLLWSRRRAHAAWAVAALTIVWANMHGGFIFALAVIGLWVFCWGVCQAIAAGFVAAPRRHWPILAAFFVSVLGAGLLSPYGWHNLTHPLVVGGSETWKNVIEWRPIYEPGFGTTWEFYVAVGLLLGLPIVRSVINLARGRETEITADAVAMLLAAVAAAVVLMVLAMNWTVPLDSEHSQFLTDRQVARFGCGGLAAVGFAVLCAMGAKLMDGRVRISRPTAGDVATTIFHIALTFVTVAMAIRARRFIPLSILVMAPLVALEVRRLSAVIGRFWLVLPTSVALITACSLGGQKLYQFYQPEYPYLPAQTFFQRMMRMDMYPVEAATFVNDNDISGRVLAGWRWEGYLRWRCPQLKAFIGGRAQQVYREETYILHSRIRADEEFPVSVISDLGMHLAILPQDPRHRNLILRMTSRPDSRWAYIYYSDKTVILADYDHPETRALIERVVTGDLEYPDPTIALVSRAVCQWSAVVPAGAAEPVRLLIEANRHRPSRMAYGALQKFIQQRPVPPPGLLSYLEDQHERLKNLPVEAPNGYEIIESLQIVTDTLAAGYRKLGRGDPAALWSRRAREVSERREALERKWQSLLRRGH